MNTDAKILNKTLAEFNNTLKSSYTMTKLYLIQGCKDSVIYANQSMWYAILTNWKDKNPMISSMDAEKPFDKIQHPIMIKTLQNKWA